MTTHSNNLNSFTLGAGQGRTIEKLDILGEDVLVKLTSADTNGAAAIFHLTVPPMSGPPMHRHSREDEWFYVLQGQITAKIGDRQVVLDAGGSGYASRGTVHTFQNFGDATAQMLVMVTPGGFNQFFESLFLEPRIAVSGSRSNRTTHECVRNRTPRTAAILNAGWFSPPERSAVETMITAIEIENDSSIES